MLCTAQTETFFYYWIAKLLNGTIFNDLHHCESWAAVGLLPTTDDVGRRCLTFVVAASLHLLLVPSCYP